MLIAQITDTHIKTPGRRAYGVVDTPRMLQDCVHALQRLDPQPDLIVLTGDLVDFGMPEEYAYLREMLSPLHVPLIVVPGNHDERDALRAAFADHDWLPARGFLHFARQVGPLRIVGLDTVVPGSGRGELCAARLEWLATCLAAAPAQPTLLLMHHPPFLTGIQHMDAIGLTGREAFADIMAGNPQVKLILSGHLHRSIHASVGGRSALTCPSPAHQVSLDLRPGAPSTFHLEPPGFMLHRWTGDSFITHVASIGNYPGPYPFFDPAGALID
ncbi:MAG: phosphodiesterase [Rhodocyclaceae bacterium]